jgi:hypothetical protein
MQMLWRLDAVGRMQVFFDFICFIFSFLGQQVENGKGRV